MEKQLIKITDGYSLVEGDVLNIMIGKTVHEMIVCGISSYSFKVRDITGFITEEFYKDGCKLYFSSSTPVKILGVDINADIEPFTGWSFITETNLPEKSKPCVFKGNGKVITGWIDRQNKIFSTKGYFNPLEFKYFKAI